MKNIKLGLCLLLFHTLCSGLQCQSTYKQLEFDHVLLDEINATCYYGVGLPHSHHLSYQIPGRYYPDQFGFWHPFNLTRFFCDSAADQCLFHKGD